MPDAPDPDSSRDSSSPSSDRDLHTQQWEALCDQLGTSNPDEILARVQTLKRYAERDEDQVPEKEGLVTISEVEEVFRELNAKIARLRERNATLADQLEDEEADPDNLGTLHKQTEELLDALGATTVEDAHDRVETLNERIEELHQDKEALVKAGLSDAEEALDELNAVREERDRLQTECDRLREERDQEAASDDAPAGPDTSTIEAAAVIRDEIGISSPAQATALSRVIETLFERVRERAKEYGLEVEAPPGSAVGMLRRMSMHLNNLPAAEALPADAASVLGVSDTAGARTLADQARRLAALHEAALADAGLDPETADTHALLQALVNHQDTASAPPPDNALPAEVGEVLDIESIEDARELEALIDDMSSHLERLREEHELLDEAGLSPEGALTMIENMEAQLADLYHTDTSQNGQAEPAASPSLDPALVDRIDALLDARPPAADDLSTTVGRLVDRLETLSEKHAPLVEAGLSAEDALALIDEMEAQLNALYKDEDPQAAGGGDAARHLNAIEDVLGISTREEAEELSEIAHQMEVQLTELYEEKQKLQDLGLSSFEDAADMIKNMEDQLNDLYEDKEALRDLEQGGTEEQSTFQQLEALYAERQKLQQALGVSAAEDVIEMVETLSSQLDDVYTGRDADVDPEERRDAQLWSPDVPDPEADPSAEPADASTTASTPSPDEATPSEAPSVTLTSMEHQLESLYREKEALLKHGYDSAEDAVNQLQAQRRQIGVLQRENHTYKQQFSQLKSALGTDRVPHIVEIVHTLESEADTSLSALDLSPSLPDPDDPTEYDVHIEAISAFVAPDTLDRLDEMGPEELEALDVGVVQLDEDGAVQALNEHALQLPGLAPSADASTLVGQNFFLDLAPSTNNNLFFGRFQKGQQRGEMDARFPYTFTPPNEEPTSFAVHLYRAPDSDATWLLFQPA